MPKFIVEATEQVWKYIEVEVADETELQRMIEQGDFEWGMLGDAKIKRDTDEKVKYWQINSTW